MLKIEEAPATAGTPTTAKTQETEGMSTTAGPQQQQKRQHQHGASRSTEAYNKKDANNGGSIRNKNGCQKQQDPSNSISPATA
jgi:hypothetical protein